MINFEVNQHFGRKIPRSFWQAILRNIEKELKLKKLGTISIALVGNKDMQQLNQAYRGKDVVTDVLSFSEFDVSSKFNWGLAQNYWGEVVICYPQAVKQAKENKKPLVAELEWLLVHGVLHLLGYDHQQAPLAKEMRDLEEKILSHC